MSKSLGNVVPLAEFLDQHDADDLRFFCLQARYRSR
jgi:cysteinyl-tRNA synthetase